MKFVDYSFDQGLLEAIDAMGYETPTPVQEAVLGPILERRDLIGCAQTGTGKTAAYLIPILNQIITNPGKGTSAIIIAPTRELAMQIDQQIVGLAYFLSISSMAVYGGGDAVDYDLHRKALMTQSDIIVATPGKLLMHLNMGHLTSEGVRCLVLDEADRMLDMGFIDDIMRIIHFLPEERQTLMFSATMPPKIRDLAKKILKDPVEVNLAVSKPSDSVMQAAYLVHDKHKIALIGHLLKGKDLKSVLIFASTKLAVKDVARNLKKVIDSVEEIHSDLEQQEREAVLLRFRTQQTHVLVATDVLARGIDIDTIELVINYDVPRDAEDYVHRVGRTARAEREGVAITFINGERREQDSFKRIEQLLETTVYKLKTPVELGEGPEYNPSASGGKSNGNYKQRRFSSGRPNRKGNENKSRKPRQAN
ncbi:MAG: DEAD/DEAH box helicase [Bacteroidota bacterium]|nr:DEAD/DEAH box helicase [Bacteroidota bacterium]